MRYPIRASSGIYPANRQVFASTQGGLVGVPAGVRSALVGFCH